MRDLLVEARWKLVVRFMLAIACHVLHHQRYPDPSDGLIESLERELATLEVPD